MSKHRSGLSKREEGHSGKKEFLPAGMPLGLRVARLIRPPLLEKKIARAVLSRVPLSGSGYALFWTGTTPFPCENYSNSSR